MARVIKFTELRRIKDNLPDGTMHQIAETLKRMILNLPQ